MPPGDAEIRWNLGGYHGAHMLQTRLTGGKKNLKNLSFQMVTPPFSFGL